MLFRSDGLVIIEAARRGHATYAGFHTYPEKWLSENYYVTEYLANRLGYWFTVNNVSHMDKTYTGVKTLVSLEIENMGFSRCYDKFVLEVKLSGENKEFITQFSEFDIRTVDAGEKRTARVFADTPDVPGRYTVSVRLREGKRSILLALRQESCDSEGFYALSEIEIKDMEAF